MWRNVLADSRPIMKASKASILPGLVVGLILSGCNQKAPSKNQASVFRLFDLFQPEDLTGKVTLDNAGWKPMEWRAQDMAPWTPPANGETNSPRPAAAWQRPSGLGRPRHR